MKAESSSGVVHRAEFFDSKYFEIARTKCGREMMLVSFVPEDGCVRKTQKKISCKNCLKSRKNSI